MQKVLRLGNSLAVVIPAKFVEAVGIHKGDLVKVLKKPESGKISFIFKGAKQLPLQLTSKRTKLSSKKKV